MKNDQFKSELAALSDEQLLHEVQKRRGLFYVNVVLIVLMTANSIYGFTRTGFSVITILPLIFLPMLIAGQRRYKEAMDVLRSRKP